MADMHGAGGVGGDVLDIDGNARAGGAVTIRGAGAQDVRQLRAQGVRVQAYVDEAGTGRFGVRDRRVGCQRGGDRGGDISGFGAGGACNDQCGVGGHVAVCGVTVRGDLDAAGDIVRQAGVVCGQAGHNGGAQIGVEVVHGCRVLMGPMRCSKIHLRATGPGPFPRLAKSKHRQGLGEMSHPPQPPSFIRTRAHNRRGVWGDRLGPPNFSWPSYVRLTLPISAHPACAQPFCLTCCF